LLLSTTLRRGEMVKEQQLMGWSRSRMRLSERTMRKRRKLVFLAFPPSLSSILHRVWVYMNVQVPEKA
jgi:hypothetical protein